MLRVREVSIAVVAAGTDRGKGAPAVFRNPQAGGHKLLGSVFDGLCQSNFGGGGLSVDWERKGQGQSSFVGEDGS